MSLLIQNIQLLAGVSANYKLLKGPELSKLRCINDAFLVIEHGRIADYGSMSDFMDDDSSFKEIIDAKGQTILPAWCDSHTHIVFAASREDEFIKKIKGMSYSEIAASGGGILNSAAKIHTMPEEELYEIAVTRILKVMEMGTGAIEIKSGYGLSVEDELKMLRVIQRLKKNAPIPVKATFLGAHTYPLLYKENHKGYLDLLITEMLPEIGRQQLADYVDVFCETGFFSPDDMERICLAAAAYGLKPKLHTNQLNSMGGLQKAVDLDALSVDHLETMTEADIADLAASKSIGTLLPTAAYFLRMPFSPARKMIDAGCALALASDYNPGSSPSGNMNMVVSMSCIQMKMLPEEAINAATINGAFAMELQDEVGSITPGKRANLIFMHPIPSLAYLPYSFGENLIDRVMINGEFI